MLTSLNFWPMVDFFFINWTSIQSGMTFRIPILKIVNKQLKSGGILRKEREIHMLRKIHRFSNRNWRTYFHPVCNTRITFFLLKLNQMIVIKDNQDKNQILYHLIKSAVNDDCTIFDKILLLQNHKYRNFFVFPIFYRLY